MKSVVHQFFGIFLFVFLNLTLILAQNTFTPSVHVLDNLSGGNGVNITCKFYRRTEDEGFQLLSTQSTDSVGRVNAFIPAVDYTPGTYRIWLGIKEYFNAQDVPTFYPAIQITYRCVDPSLDHHVPVALSPFGFVTYRGG